MITSDLTFLSAQLILTTWSFNDDMNILMLLLQINYSLVVILELNSVSEVQYKKVMIIDDE